MEYKKYIKEIGVDANYWELLAVQYNIKTNQRLVRYLGYASKQAYEESASAIATLDIEVDPFAFDFTMNPEKIDEQVLKKLNNNGNLPTTTG